MLCDYATLELSSPRLVTRNKDWIALVPYWAQWPFEVLVLPFKHKVGLLDLGDDEKGNVSYTLF